jgi:class 3 adenylate cyclase/tetratricopeptide (TPR) repeat protein
MIDWSPADRALLRALLPDSLAQALEQPAPARERLADVCARLEVALAALVPFVPAPVIDLHMIQPERGRITGLSLAGTVLAADLSGFTALSAHLAAAGRSGSEEISALVNRLFAALVEEVYAHGGGVIQFGGDGLTAFFDTKRAGAHHAALGCAAALAMQARMAAFTAVPTSRGPFLLRLRVAVHSGTLFAAEVGDASHTELVVTGKVINQVVKAQERAAPGQVIISEETRQSLADAQVHPTRGGLYLLRSLAGRIAPPASFRVFWQPDPPSETTIRTLLARIRAVQPFMPHRLPDRFLQVNAEGGEFRPVTVFFARFYTLRKALALLALPSLYEQNTSLVGQVLNSYYTRIQTVVHHYGGTINKVDMASFGNRVLALFGAPVTHEDDPARAMQAAQALRMSFAEADREIVALLRDWGAAHPAQRARLRALGKGFPQRIGIAEGTVFAGIIGTPQRPEYTAMGETVNLAARLLASSAEGEVLLTSRTYRAVRHVAETEPLPPRTLKGFSRPVAIFRAGPGRSSAADQRQAAPLVGRAVERTRLSERIQRAFSPEAAGQVIALVGDAGIGKTRLAEEVLREFQAGVPALLLARDTCQSFEQPMPYAPIGRLLRQMLRLPPPGDPQAQAAAVQQQLEVLVPLWSRFAPLLGPVLNVPIPDTPLTAALTADQRRDRLHDLVVMLIFALAQHLPLVIVVDDLQWADASSLALIRRLANELAGQPILLLLIYRPSASLAEPWGDPDHYATITVTELSAAENEELLRTLLEGEPPPELRPLLARMAGTPFFVEETVRYLLEAGVLRRTSSGAWVPARAIDAITIPSRLEQLIVARLDRLHVETRALAQVAAVIGLRFSEALLEAVAAPRAGLQARLNELVDAAVLVRDTSDPAPAYRFKHALIREVAYSSLLFARRHTLHIQVAAAIEQIEAADLASRHTVLAQHYYHAEQWERALPHFVAAAGQAQARHAHSEAVAVYEQALAIAPWREGTASRKALAVRLPIHENLGDVLTLTGEYPRARGQYETLLALLADAGEDYIVQRAAVQRKVGGTFEHEGDLEQALSWLARAAATIHRAPPGEAAHIQRATILSDIGWVHFRQGHLDEAERHLEQALALLAPLAAYAEQAPILNRLGGIAWSRGAMDQARAYVEQGLEASEHSGDLVGQARALNNLGILTGSQGLTADAIRYGLQAMEINERIGRRRELATAAINVGWAFYDQEDHEQARHYFAQAVRQATETHDPYHRMLALLGLGRALTAQGRLTEAEAASREGQTLAAQLHLPGEELESHVALAEIALLRGDLAAALAEHAQGLPLATDPGTGEYGRFQRLEALLAHAQGRPDQALDLLAASEALFVQLHNTPEAGRTRRLRERLTPAVEVRS